MDFSKKYRSGKVMFGRKQQRNMEDLTASLSELKREFELWITVSMRSWIRWMRKI